MRRALKRKILKTYKEGRNKIKPKSLALFFDYLYDLIFKKEDVFFIQNHFNNQFDYPLNLKNPQTYNEKIQWLKLNDRTKLHTLCADKLLVRKHIASTIGEKYLIPLFFNTNQVQQITPSKLPNISFIIKTNHDSGTYFIVKNKENQDWNYIQKKLKASLESNYYFNLREWQYRGIEPQIIVEKLLTGKDGSIPYDYKFHCANGNISFIQVDMDRGTNHTRNIYDVNWNLLPVEFHKSNGEKTEQPSCLNKMIELAKKLSSPFAFARIDFYELDQKIYFGEITFHPEGGFGSFTPKEWDLTFGKEITLPLNK